VGQVLLGASFLDGVGVEKNQVRAVELFQTAAD
jgi:TPR repeat protein